MFNKLKELQNDYSSRKLSVAGTYLGGYVDRTNKQATLFVYADRVEINGTLRPKITMPTEDIKGIKVESPDEVQKRVTVGRLLALGIFSLAFKKKVKECFVVTEMKDGREVIFHVKGSEQMEVRAKLSTVIAQFKQ